MLGVLVDIGLGAMILFGVFCLGALSVLIYTGVRSVYEKGKYYWEL